MTKVCLVRYRIPGTGMDIVPNLPNCPVPVLVSYRTYQSVRYRYWCTEITEVSGTGMNVCTGTGGTGIHVVPNLPKCPVPVLMSCRTYQSVRYRYWCCTELTKVSGTGIDVLPNSPKCMVPVLMSYRTYRSVLYGYWCRTELTEVSGIGIDVVPNLPKCPVPVLMSYRTHRSVWYRCWCHTELTEVVLPAVDTGGMPRYVPYRTHSSLYAVQKVPFRLSTEKKSEKQHVFSLNLKENK